MIPVSQQRLDSPSSGQKVRQIWTPAEDQLLARAVQIETPKSGSISWCSVASHLPGRNNKDCRKRWHYSIAHGHTIRKGTWTREEDQRLRDAVVIHGTRWSKIAQVVGTRNGDQCWKRWYDCLDPRIDKSPWTPEEDEKLVRMVAKHGRNWTGIVNKHFPKRTSLSAKNRYSILQRKQEPKRGNLQGRRPSRSSTYTSGINFHARNLSTESGGSTVTAATSDNGFYNIVSTASEPDYQSESGEQQQDPQIIHDHRYWSSSGSISNPSIPSGSSSPDSTHADLVDWPVWSGMSDTHSPDPASSSVSVSYDIDTTTCSYLSPSPTLISTHSPFPDFQNSMVGGGCGDGFYHSANGFPSAAAASPSSSNFTYPPVLYNTAGMPDESIQYMIPSYKTW